MAVFYNLNMQFIMMNAMHRGFEFKFSEFCL